MTKTYIAIDWSKTKARAKAQKAYQEAYAAMKQANAVRVQIIADELVKANLIPDGTIPVLSIRPWDGQAQLVKGEDGAIEYKRPKAAGQARDQGETF